MDAQRFDCLIRSLLTPSSRRQALIRLTGGLVPLSPLLPGNDAAAKNRKKRRKRKKKNQCKPACSGAKVCKGGNCVCPSGTDECGGECLNQCGGSVSARNPLTCECCLLPLASSGSSASCCSGQWIPNMCLGHGAGHECDFDAQCSSGDCNGFCGT